MTTGSCLAAVSGSLSVQKPNVGWFAVLAILIGAAVSYSVRVALLSSKYVKLDGILYTLAMISALTFGANLQQFMPDGGFDTDVLAAGWLVWMLILGSFFTWQDSTLLFQAVPAIALFGLSGIYSTWNGVTFAFFAFMICLATLVARAHRRAMLVQAAESGYFTRGLAPGSPTPSVETTPGLARRMQEGPWKWIAGPEWALVSAFAIIVISLLGAPVVQLAVQPVSGFAKMTMPRSVAARFSRAASSGLDPGSSIGVGNGPNQLSPTPVLEVRSDPLDRVYTQYLRTAAYYGFSSDFRWSLMKPPPPNSPNGDPGAATIQSIISIENQHEFAFDIRLRKPLRYLPTPGFVTQWDATPAGLAPTFDGRTQVTGQMLEQTLTGHAIVPKPGVPGDTGKDLPAMFADARSVSVSPRVAQLVRMVTAGAKTDYEKAQRIREKIAATIKYNINAPAIPPGNDPVDYVMFSHPEAYCDVFATAMTLMAREAGIPARFVYGYRPDPGTVDANGWNVALESDLHSWSELYFQDYGWVIFDATDGADAVPGAGRGSWNSETSFWTLPWVQRTIDILIALGLFSGLALGGRAIYVAQRSRTPRTDLDRAYVRFTRLLERRSGSRRTLAATPDEFLAGVATRLGAAYAPAAELNDQFVRLLYSPRPTTAEDVAGIRNRLKQLAKQLRHVD